MTISFHILSNSIFINHPMIQCSTLWVTDAIVKCITNKPFKTGLKKNYFTPDVWYEYPNSRPWNEQQMVKFRDHIFELDGQDSTPDRDTENFFYLSSWQRGS
jgi:hypothetical protein